MCQGFSHLKLFFASFVLAKLATSSIRVKRQIHSYNDKNSFFVIKNCLFISKCNSEEFQYTIHVSDPSSSGIPGHGGGRHDNKLHHGPGTPYLCLTSQAANYTDQTNLG